MLLFKPGNTMMNEYNLSGMVEKINLLKKAATELKELSDDFPAVERNVARILADVRVLELDVVDVVDILKD